MSVHVIECEKREVLEEPSSNMMKQSKWMHVSSLYFLAYLKRLESSAAHSHKKVRKKTQILSSPLTVISGDLENFKGIIIYLSLKFVSHGFCYLLVCSSQISFANLDCKLEYIYFFLLRYVILLNEFPLCNTHIPEKRITSLFKENTK